MSAHKPKRMHRHEFTARRERLGHTSKSIAEKLDRAPQTVRHMETGQNKIPYGMSSTMRNIEHQFEKDARALMEKSLKRGFILTEEEAKSQQNRALALRVTELAGGLHFIEQEDTECSI